VAFLTAQAWLVATPSGKHAKVVRAVSARGALLGRFKDEEDIVRGGVWAVWKLGNFPVQFDLEADGGPRDIGRPALVEGRSE
jgi:hypothetical protein